MFIWSFPDEKIQKFLKDKDNLKKLKKVISQIRERFGRYPFEKDFCIYSVINHNKEQALRSYSKLKGYENVLVKCNFLINSGHRGTILLFVDNKASLHSLDGIPFEGKKPYEPFKGTWEEVISEYINFLNL